MGVEGGFEFGASLVGGDVADETLAAWDRADWNEIDADARCVKGHVFAGNLHPTTWGGAEIKDASVGGGEKVEAFVELDELE